MTYLAPRSCTKIAEDNQRYSYPLKDFRDSPAYVLLGEPGIGKTEAFREEARQQESSAYITARDLITFRVRPEWRDRTLFIDGLDEIRAGADDPRGPFDAIRACLEKLGRPRFRLSCREADWLGNSDREQLQKVAPDSYQIEELHLDELSDEDIARILRENYQSEVKDPSAFVAEASEQGLSGLIRNPQILKMLVTAVSGDGRWPSSRRETFELACRRILAKEHSLEHEDAQRTQPYAIEERLEAAGYLFALILLSDLPDISLSESSATSQSPTITDTGFKDTRLLLITAKSKLFHTSNNCTTYVHRTVAEYLAAYYLKKQMVEKGLPLDRVLALMTGKDGVAVTALRGLFAWLVTLSESQRELLLERDPLGVLLYGDATPFSVTDKQKILESFRDEANRHALFREHHWSKPYFGTLCTKDMELRFRGYLQSSDRTEAHQLIVDCVLAAMKHGERLPGLADCLHGIIRDSSWWSGIRGQALHALIHIVRDAAGRDAIFKKLLQDIYNGNMEDQGDNLLGVLLKELYPHTVSAAEIFDYLRPSKSTNHFGLYEQFWSIYLDDLSHASHLAVLLDELVSRQQKLELLHTEFSYRSMISKLLLRGLKIHGEIISAERLSDWLGLGLDKNGYSFIHDEDELKQIREWIETHPDMEKAIIESQIGQCGQTRDFSRCMREFHERFYRAPLPADYGPWCLNKAILSNEADICEYFIQEAVRTLYYEMYNEGLSLELLERTAVEYPRLAPWIQEMMYEPINREKLKHKREISQIREKQKQEQNEYIQFVKKNIDAIQTGTAESGILYTLGRAYYGHFIDFHGDNPVDRLTNYFGDKDLVYRILQGFKKTLNRHDIPDVEEIFHLKLKQNKVYLLSFPVMAGMEEISRENGKKIHQLPEDLLRKSLAFYFNDGFDSEPGWYLELVRDWPELVSEILVGYARGALRSRQEHIPGIYSLAFDEKYRNVARDASLPILNAFPTRCTVKQLECMDHLLKSALFHADPDLLHKLIVEKFKLKKSMNMAQYAHWLGVAFVISPAKYRQAMVEYFDGKYRRIRYLAGFLTSHREQLSLVKDLDDTALTLLIRMFGEFYTPYPWGEGNGRVTASMETADLIQMMVNKLSVVVTDQATKEIQDLLKLKKLHQWQGSIRSALYQQLANKREADFQHPDIKQVVATLQNLAPANVADLAALVSDHIRDLAIQIRHGDTDDYKQYWNLDSHGRPDSRRHEEACRDALLSDLKLRLAPLEIDAVAEGHYAKDKRSDIRISFGGTNGYNVPIEIKCNDHQQLWYAVHEQLIAKYTRDPGAHGYGIYLVFWFGPDRTTIPPQGDRPMTAVELENRLRQLLSNENDKRLITICVIDVQTHSK